MKKRAAPIIAAVLILLPVLYVGNYLALVVPSPNTLQNRYGYTRFTETQTLDRMRWGPEYSDAYRIESERLAQFFWPLEQIDRRVRPTAWERRSRL